MLADRTTLAHLSQISARSSAISPNERKAKRGFNVSSMTMLAARALIVVFVLLGSTARLGGSRQLSQSGPVICSQAVDLAIGQFCGDGTHSSINVIAPLPRRKHFKLRGKVFLSLLGEDRGIDRPASAMPMAGGAWRNVPVRITEFHQLYDRVRRPQRVWIRIAHRLARVIGGDISDDSFVERLCDIGHELIGAAASVVVIQLLVNCSSRLPGEVRKFR